VSSQVLAIRRFSIIVAGNTGQKIEIGQFVSCAARQTAA